MKYRTWESEHYTFHYALDTPAEAEITEIAATQEACFEKITSVLKTVPSFKIQYWLCHTPEEVGQIYGDNEPCNGFACEPDTIYAVYNDEIHCIGPHEDAHLISYLLGIPASVFLREGLAMYFDETWWNKPNDSWTAEYIRSGKALPLQELLLDDVFYAMDCSVTYPIAGSFTKYLIERFGFDSYMKFYQYEGMDWERAVLRNWKCTLCALDLDFQQAILSKSHAV